ncbi:MAG TPA: SDR family oxidoreductase [Pyrinomonadaceae bacterium]|nr:SDR family oxidoreductase [Pyrinomonadaceae bacterium]
MKILIIGGTVFLGRHLVEAAQARGHEVTLFNRGLNNPELFPDVEKLRGDREGDLAALRGRRWDTVIDTCGFVPRVVRASAEMLKDAVERYIFISTLSVVADSSVPGNDETAPIATMKDPSDEERTPENYGPLKALCEQAVLDVYKERALNIRPGLIVGPHDPTGRFTYWPVRVARGGEVLAPGRPQRQIQFIDARDLADWIIRIAEARASGTFNATGPAGTLMMEELLEECRRVTGSDARFTWVSEKFLAEKEVGEWMELPLWISEEASPDARGFMALNCAKAVAHGLNFRPMAETIRDTLDWANSLTEAPAPDSSYAARAKAGMEPEREAQLLKEWLEAQRQQQESVNEEETAPEEVASHS